MGKIYTEDKMVGSGKDIMAAAKIRCRFATEIIGDDYIPGDDESADAGILERERFFDEIVDASWWVENEKWAYNVTRHHFFSLAGQAYPAANEIIENCKDRKVFG
ncbi:hypothetical protein LJC41_08740 [Desulfosarcina sp. OttesenSCG-928-G17]|nr:hypothetical protein [Desulfosarcina sp. OttesenSCG-928-G17]